MLKIPKNMKVDDLRMINVYGPVVDQLKDPSVPFHAKQGRIIADFATLDPATPWLHTKYALDRNCARWHKIYFPIYKILPRHCLNCWKVVVRPKNLEMLFELHELMEKLQLPSKCGVDVRPWSTYKGIYLGFFYGKMAEGFEGGRKLFDFVKNRVRGALSLDTSVILKRGCTEFEDRFGPSNEWVYPPQHHIFEDMLDAVWKVNVNYEPQPTAMKVRIRELMIQFAFERMGDRDPTIRKFMRDYPRSMGVTPTTTYHDKKPSVRMEVAESNGRKFQGLSEDERRSNGSGHWFQEAAVGAGPGTGRGVGLGGEKVGDLEIPWPSEESQKAEGSPSNSRNDSPDKEQEVSGAGS